MNIVFYFSNKDEHVQEIKNILEDIQVEHPHKLVEVLIDDDADIYQEYLGKTPVIEAGPYHLYSPFTKQDVIMIIGAAKDRQISLEKTNNKEYNKKVERGANFTGSDKFTFWLTKHYMMVFNILLFVFVGLPFLAPVLEKSKMHIPANIIYKIYSPLCHQLGYRSWYLFGEQAAYPRELAGEPGITFEEATGINSVDVLAAKNFIGNEKIGYKVAICERDVAIYGGILMFGLIFALSGKKLKSLRWYYWIILGIVPIAVDGISQLPALLSIYLRWIPIRESTPLLRTITGLLFGISTAWYGYPLIEETMRESRRVLTKKIAVNEIK